MTPQAFRTAGEALYGPRWASGLATALSCSPRSVRRWAAGSWPVPLGVENDVALMVAARRATLEAMAPRPEPKPKAPAPEAEAEAIAPKGPPRWMIDEERARLEREGNP